MIKKRLLVVTLLLVFSMLSIQNAAAQILFSQPNAIYNVGDAFSMDLNLIANAATNDFLTASIVCNDNIVEIYRNPLNMQAGQQQTVSISALLSKSVIGDVVGDCHISASYGGDSAQSQEFEISNSLEVTTQLVKNKFLPGETIVVTGTASKLSGSTLQGFVEAKIEAIGVFTSAPVTNGEFTINVVLSNSSIAGTHTLSIRVYENDANGEVSNEGTFSEPIQIDQVLTSMEVQTSSQSIFPEDSLSYSVKAYDQSGSEMQADIQLIIYEPGDFVNQQKVVKTGESFTLSLGINATPGYWKIESTSGDVSARKLFYLEEVRKIHSSLINDTLVIVNVGNVLYEGPIEVAIGSVTEVKQISLAVGETQKFHLTAPTGTYLVKVKEGEEDTSLGSVLLTGNAIGINDIKDSSLLELSSPRFLIILIVFLVLAIVYIRLKKMMSMRAGTYGMSKPQKVVSSAPPRKITPAPAFGNREKAAVVALKLSSRGKTAEISELLGEFTKLVKSAGGKIYTDESYQIALFSQTITRQQNNEMLAIRVSKHMEEMIVEYNRRHKEKVLFGLGANSGEILSEVKGSEFTFTSIGTLVSRAKRIASGFEGQALASRELYRKVAGEAKFEKTAKEDVWKISGIRDRSKQADFLKRYLK